MNQKINYYCLLAFLLLPLSFCSSEDWMQFRGLHSAGISQDKNVPLKWSDSENLVWKVALPGPGSSSPVVLGERVFVTCYSGYGVPKSNGGSLATLARHLVCVNRADGKLQWTKSIAGGSPEDSYQGYISEHGYASSTPVTDGSRVYCFFGKSGVVAFDLLVASPSMQAVKATLPSRKSNGPVAIARMSRHPYFMKDISIGSAITD